MTPESNNTEPSADTTSQRADVRRRSKTAAQWLEQVEHRLAELSSQRHALRAQIQAQRDQRRAGNPLGEETLSVRTAHQVAKGRILGDEWQHAVHALKQASQRVRVARKQLNRFLYAQRLIRERSSRWIYRLFKSPYYSLKSQPLHKRLRQANTQRRRALRMIRQMRPAVNAPDTRARILSETENLIVADERLKHNLENLQQTVESLSSTISQGLRLAPQLCTLGKRQLTMEQRVDPVTRELSIPIPVDSLDNATQTHAKKPRIRIR